MIAGIDLTDPDPDTVLASPHLSQRQKESALTDWIRWKLAQTAKPVPPPDGWRVIVQHKGDTTDE
jgi:hypothetical protein